MGKVMRHTLGASLNIRHNLSSSKGPKPLQLKLLTTYLPKTSAFTLAFSTSQRLRRSEERRVGKSGDLSSRRSCTKSKNTGMKITVIASEDKKREVLTDFESNRRRVSRT